MDWKTHYSLYREGYLARNKRKRDVSTRIIREIKDQPCADCGKRYPYYVMDLDHVTGVKVDSLSKMKSYSEERIREEIAKCDVVCANCHRERTHQRGTY